MVRIDKIHVWANLLMWVLRSRCALGYMRQPIGVRMCQILCQNTVGCSYPIYSPENLQCHIPENIVQKKEMNALNSSSCMRSSRIIYTRNGDVRCLNTYGVGADQFQGGQHALRPTELQGVKHPLGVLIHPDEDGRSTFNKTRLLFAPRSYKGEESFCQFFFSNNSVERYPLNNDLYIRALAYISQTQTILVASDKDVVSFSRSGGDINYILKNVACSSMHVDDGKYLLFAACRGKLTETAKHTYYILRMKTNGQNTTCIKTFKEKSMRRKYVLCIDHSRGIVYVNTRKQIVSFDYWGNTIGSNFDPWFFLSGLAIDPRRNELYYFMNADLYKVTPVKWQPTKISNLNEKLSSIVYDAGKVYCSCRRRGGFHVVELNGSSRYVETPQCLGLGKNVMYPIP